jgi:CO/xanthine dehydrogenase Mo-binding subunit
VQEVSQRLAIVVLGLPGHAGIRCPIEAVIRPRIHVKLLVPPKAMPYRNPLGLVYDSGDYPASLRRAAELGDWMGFAVRRAEARRRGRCRGIGVAMSTAPRPSRRQPARGRYRRSPA